ncbi:hypothetical protein P3F83_07770 [Mycobacteroides immunogenum]|uniref:hypothetical protein n=1 Tax=Mycobacteroides immunogenum TaxID=83262 RepID=UPI0025B7912F|nr:hypothetical protein [Mycobacteroides immunogenum]WJR35258.1 hypothetical protein P3F83_07770 [Mycobacteroides immunogenum]
MNRTLTITGIAAAVTVTSLLLAGCAAESTGTLGTDWDAISGQAQADYEHVQGKTDEDFARDRDAQQGEDWDSQPETERIGDKEWFELHPSLYNPGYPDGITPETAPTAEYDIPSEYDITSEPEEPFRFMSATAAPVRFPYPGEDTSDWVCVDSPTDPQICIMTPPEELR